MAHAQVAQALQIELDTDPLTASRLPEARVCPDSGQWLREPSGL